MKVKELIEQLTKLEPDAEVSVFWDGAPRGDIEGIYVSAPNSFGYRGGEVVLVGDWSIYRERIQKEKAIRRVPPQDPAG